MTTVRGPVEVSTVTPADPISGMTSVFVDVWVVRPAHP